MYAPSSSAIPSPAPPSPLHLFHPLHTVAILPEKPNYTVPASNPDPASVALANTLLHDLSCLKDTDKLPHERFALPVTGATRLLL